MIIPVFWGINRKGHILDTAPAASVSNLFDALRTTTFGYLHGAGFTLQDTQASGRE